MQASSKPFTQLSAQSLGVVLMAAWFCCGCAQESPEAVWNEARQAYEKRDLDAVEKAMNRLGKLRDPLPEDFMMLSSVALKKGNSDQALDYLSRVPHEHPMGIQALLQQGQIELRRNRARFAADKFREAIKVKPDLAQAHKELIYILSLQLRRQELAAEFKALSEIEPLTFEQAFHWCLTRGSQWEPVEISEIMTRFLKADPDDHNSRLALVDALRKLQRLDEAEKELGLLPLDNPDARAARAMLALDRGNDEEAEKILSEGPTQHLGLALLRGRLAMARNDNLKAIAAFKAALTADPENREAVFGYAHSLQRANDPAAKKWLDLSGNLERVGTLVQRAAMPTNKNNPELVRELGAACVAAGRTPEARAWYQVAIRINPLDSQAQQALFKIKK
jgi:tetratricopeptide (TPR) repeat protein